MNLDLIGEPIGSVKEMMTNLEQNGIPVTINGTPTDQSVVLVLISAIEGPTKASKSYIDKWKGKNVFLAGILLTDADQIDDDELIELVYLESEELVGSPDDKRNLLLSNDKNIINKVKTRAANPSKIFPFGTCVQSSKRTNSEKPWWKFW